MRGADMFGVVCGLRYIVNMSDIYTAALQVTLQTDINKIWSVPQPDGCVSPQKGKA